MTRPSLIIAAVLCAVGGGCGEKPSPKDLHGVMSPEIQAIIPKRPQKSETVRYPSLVIENERFSGELIDVQDGTHFIGCQFIECRWPDRDTNYEASSCKFINCDKSGITPIGGTFRILEWSVWLAAIDPFDRVEAELYAEHELLLKKIDPMILESNSPASEVRE